MGSFFLVWNASSPIIIKNTLNVGLFFHKSCLKSLLKRIDPHSNRCVAEVDAHAHSRTAERNLRSLAHKQFLFRAVKIVR